MDTERAGPPLSEVTTPHLLFFWHWLLALSVALWGIIGVGGWLIWRLFQ